MKKSELQLFLGKSVTESKMSKQTKLQLLNFIQHEASTVQLMVLALDGKITRVDSQAAKVIEDRFAAGRLAEAMTQVGRDVTFGYINRIFGACAKKCGRIAVSSEASACKQKCIAARDAATLKARVKAKQNKMSAKLAKSQVKVVGK
ncbi:hypothetical protein KAR91_06645 [Candidatus Pacearchaeota archaeon]|nr:hypothetical protein [Candidatus Pacearchaeota archaeon]